jgi:hypothetical protein
VTSPPANPRIFHITHVDNLASILAGGWLLSDSAMIARGGPPQSIGMADIKARRLGMPVSCHTGTTVGDYVPFYYCPRSIMLYLIHMKHPNLRYKEGQDSIVHLSADLHTVLTWANAQARRWAFSLQNAAAGYAQFRNKVTELDQINWQAVQSTNFSNAAVKEGKQAEFLLHEMFPCSLIDHIGVLSAPVEAQVRTVLQQCRHRAAVQVLRNWYY